MAPCCLVDFRTNNAEYPGMKKAFQDVEFQHLERLCPVNEKKVRLIFYCGISGSIPDK